MGEIEQKLRQLILQKYGSVKVFAEKINIPYTTVDSILKRGIENSNAKSLNKISLNLDLDLAALLNGRIEYIKFRDTIGELTEQEKEDLMKYAEFLKSQRVNQ